MIYAKSLSKMASKLNKACREIPGSVAESWRGVATEMESRGEVHRQFSSSLTEEIVKPLKVILDNQHKARKTVNIESTKYNINHFTNCLWSSKKIPQYHLHFCLFFLLYYDMRIPLLRLSKQVESSVDKSARLLGEWRASEAKAKKSSHAAARENEKLQDALLDVRWVDGWILIRRQRQFHAKCVSTDNIKTL